MAERRPARAFWMGLATLLGLRRKGFFIPYRHAETLPPPGGNPAYAEIESIFANGIAEMDAVLNAIQGFGTELTAIGPDAPPQPRWNQHWFPGLDGAAAYALTRRHTPARIVEVGSGHSTRFFARAVADGGLATKITAIDPAPRAALDGLAIELVRSTVHGADKQAFAALAAGDFLVIDSSHILMPGSDVDLLFNRVLPALPAGAFVHVHDVFLPDDYPAQWGWRGYNEQQGVAALLQGGSFELVFASHFVRTRRPERLTGAPFAHFAPPPGAFETSLWLRKSAI